MRHIARRTVVLGVALAVGAVAAAEFRASDLLYLPVAAHNVGAAATEWRTDLTITNVDEVPVDVCVFFFPSGLFNNAQYLARTYGLGGRTTEEWGHVNEALADIPPLGTVVLDDVVAVWLDQLAVGTVLGAMVIFAYEAGTLDRPEGRVPRNAIASSRTYNATTVWLPDPDDPDQLVERPARYGQGVPAVPWYNLADPSYLSDQGDFTHYILTGGEESATTRYNMGIFNCSDPQTTVIVRVEPFQSDGEPFRDDEGEARVSFVSLPPLAHVQYFRIFNGLFQIPEATGATLRVSFYSWTTTSPDPIPAFAVYGSQVDGVSNDPSTVLPSFSEPYNVDCMWPPAAAGSKAEQRVRSPRRPLDIPPRLN